MEEGQIEINRICLSVRVSQLLDVPVTQVITTCMSLGIIVSINQRLDAEIIELVANEFGHEIEFISAEEESDKEEKSLMTSKIYTQEHQS